MVERLPLWGLLARDARVARSYRIAFLMTLAGLVMSLITFRFIATLAADAPSLRGVGNYFNFVVIGMAVASLLEGAVNAPSTAVRGEQVQGTMDVLAASPASASSLALGLSAYPLIQGLVGACVLLAAAGPMGFRFEDPRWELAIPALLLATLAFAAVGIAIAAVVLLIQQAASLTRWVTGVLSLISGVFFPLALLPAWVRVIAELSPLTHALRALRGALIDRGPSSLVVREIGWLGLITLVALPLAILLFSRALEIARRRGTLGIY